MSGGAETADLRFSVESVVPATPAVQGHWRITFGIHNAGSAAVHLDEAWLPHGQFRGAARMPVGVSLDPGQSLSLEATVHVVAPPRTIIENAFLILTISRGLHRTRVFVRLRVPIDAHGAPQPRIDHVSSQTS